MVASLAIGFQNTARYGLLIWVPAYFLGSSWKGEEGTKWISIALPVGMAIGAMSSGWISDVLFKSKIWHFGSDPSLYFNGLRMTLAYKLMVYKKGTIDYEQFL